ncbi:hypothetical protein JCM10207_004255 [Rhodosporidiobolus poonsookiae]
MASQPPSTAASIASLRTALSNADDAAQAAHLLFSPDRKSTQTVGSGATGSTEEAGAATRSLVLSVAGRDADAQADRRLSASAPALSSLNKPRVSDTSTASSAATSASSSWDQALSVVGSPRMGAPLVHLPTPEPDHLHPYPHSDEHGSISQLLPPAEVDSPLIKPEPLDPDEDEATRLLLRGDGPGAAAEEHEHLELTHSQENALLERNVTRSQSDFLWWVEEQQRWASGRTESQMESDDALSSILRASQNSFGGSASVGTSFGLGAPFSLAASLLESLDPEREDGEEEQQAEEADEVGDLTLQSVSEVDREQHREDAESVEAEQRAEKQADEAPLPSAKPPATLPWKLLSLFLAGALVYSLARQPEVIVQAILEEPTPSLRYVPINESLIEVSAFATPLPIGPTFGAPAYALFSTLLAAAAASVPLFRRRLGLEDENESPPTEARRSRATSPLAELNGEDLLKARQLLQTGMEQYETNQLSRAAATFSTIVHLACGAPDRAIASEWLGRALYRLARRDGNDAQLLQRSIGAFERSVRLDGTRASPRASLGRARYRGGDFKGALLALRAAVKRDDGLAFAHEWLAKALAASSRPGAASEEIEAHLLRAIDLSPLTAARAHAFLGEYLHLTFSAKRLADARAHLERATALRADYPAAHARLAFIANEALDPAAAAASYAAVCATRASGLRDETLQAEEATRGATPFRGWVFATPPRSEERRSVLKLATAEHPHDDLLQLLSVVEAAAAEEDAALDDEDSATPPASPTQRRTLRAASPPVTPPACAALAAHTAALARRAARYPAAEDLPGHGLLAVALVASGQGEEGERAWGAFWAGVTATNRAEEVEGEDRKKKRDVAFLAAAYWESKRVREDRDRVEEPTPTPTPALAAREPARAVVKARAMGVVSPSRKGGAGGVGKVVGAGEKGREKKAGKVEVLKMEEEEGVGLRRSPRRAK